MFWRCVGQPSRRPVDSAPQGPLVAGGLPGLVGLPGFVGLPGLGPITSWAGGCGFIGCGGSWPFGVTGAGVGTVPPGIPGCGDWIVLPGITGCDDVVVPSGTLGGVGGGGGKGVDPGGAMLLLSSTAPSISPGPKRDKATVMEAVESQMMVWLVGWVVFMVERYIIAHRRARRDGVLPHRSPPDPHVHWQFQPGAPPSENRNS
jgi:hypothetical protein